LLSSQFKSMGKANFWGSALQKLLGDKDKIWHKWLRR